MSKETSLRFKVTKFMAHKNIIKHCTEFLSGLLSAVDRAPNFLFAHPYLRGLKLSL